MISIRHIYRVMRQKLRNFAMSDGQFCRSTKLRDKITQLCHMSDMGLRSTLLKLNMTREKI